MPIYIEKIDPIKPTGVGRKDYSEAIEFSVEPIIRSYQNVYNYNNTFTLTPGELRAVDVVVPVDRVILLYDFLMSSPANALIEFSVETCDENGTLGMLFDKMGYQKVTQRHSRGTPSFPSTIRIWMENHSALTLEAAVSLIGVWMTREQYFERVFE